MIQKSLIPIFIVLALVAVPIFVSIFRLIGGGDNFELCIDFVILGAIGLYAFWLWQLITKFKWLKGVALIHLCLFSPLCIVSICLHVFGGNKIWPLGYIKNSILLLFVAVYVAVICLKKNSTRRKSPTKDDLNL